jgi:ABC-2 type transport system ATP-binding protein
MVTDTTTTLALRAHRPGPRVPDLVVDCELRPGVNLLLGVNGVGKTTLLHSIIGAGGAAQPASVGLVRSGRSTALADAGVVLLPQRPRVPGHLSVRDLLTYCCAVRRSPTSEVARLLGTLGLASLADRKARHLSGGEVQRLSLALAFVGDPAVVLLDEPTVALDPLARAAFATALRAMLDACTVVVMTTHLAADVALADRVLLLAPDGIRWQGSAEDFRGLAPGGDFEDAFVRAHGSSG